MGITGTPRIVDPPAPVPEPVSMVFLTTGLIGVLGYVARKRMQTK
jgi:hypothetical protein